jgi:molybdenum-dependent DNA-binding transcriptional regulator ModE
MGLDLVTRSARDQHARPCILAVQVCTKSWLGIDGRFAIGPHVVELLFAIQRHDSLTRAARAIGWSYCRAWDYIR